MSAFTLFRKESAAEAARKRARDRTGQTPTTEADWARVRSAERANDRQLSRIATQWLDQLPADVRPQVLIERYPRIVNRLALCWDDPELLDRLFDDMMVDRRGKRRGFAPDVMRELLALREYTTSNRPIEERGDKWEARLQATADRR